MQKLYKFEALSRSQTQCKYHKDSLRKKKHFKIPRILDQENVFATNPVNVVSRG